MGVLGEGRGRSAAVEGAGEEGYVGGAFGEPTHEVGVPVVPEGHVHADAVFFSLETLAVRKVDAVQHLELERRSTTTVRVLSTVLECSMSTVTVVPARRAA
jgi:hypothetical protein